MRKRSTVLSLPGLVIFAILITALGLTLWRQGGLAFSPGALSNQNSFKVQLEGFNSHAEFEGQCSLCHQPLSSKQTELCVDCHTTIDNQIVMDIGLHGKLENVLQCATCHSDHQGRDYDMRLAHLSDFDHSLMDFSLIRHQVDYSMNPIDCMACHIADNQFSVSTAACTTCHAENDLDFMTSHLAEFGEQCSSCHDGLDTMARFDHTTAGFQLDGTHQEIACVDCHLEGQFEGLASDCAACHAEPAVHLGTFGMMCADCHNTITWKPALLAGQSFDHNVQTRFSLVHHTQDYSAAPMNCESCHPNGVEEFQTSTCTECHILEDQEFISQHQTQLGENCLECHDGVDRMQNFDHQELFPLDGRHAEIDCQACHLEQVYQTTPNECKDCHPEPEIHAGFFGFKCEYCHTTTGWQPARLINHQFPIDHGGQGEMECQVCHAEAYSQYSCYGCHEHQPEEISDKHKKLSISPERLNACTECHIDGLVHESNGNDE